MRIVALSLIAGVLLTAVTPALAYAPVAGEEPTPQASDTSFTGYVRFSSGEFQLYANRNQVDLPFARPCVSGVLPRDLQRQAESDLHGAKVRITGVTRVWDKDHPNLRYADSTIRNDCGGDFVIEATRMGPI
jgi:hypothetical protein